MANIDIDEFIKLLPDAPYDIRPTSNNYKIVQVLIEELNQLFDLFEEIGLLTDLENMFGATLDLFADDFGLTRDERTDEELRVIIRAKQQNQIDGNTISNAIRYFDLFITPTTNIILTELFNPALGFFLDGLLFLDGNRLLSGANNFRVGAFDVQTGVITPELENSLTDALPILKSSGIQATVNLLP